MLVEERWYVPSAQPWRAIVLIPLVTVLLPIMMVIWVCDAAFYALRRRT